MPWFGAMAYSVRLAIPLAASTRVMHCSGGDASYPVIPPEEAADAAPQPEEPSDHRGRHLAPGEHHGPHVLDRTAGATTRERNRPRVLQRYVVRQCVHAKGARAKCIWV